MEQRLKAVALQFLSKNGFSGLTLEKICTIAQIPRATFYRRWATPAALVSDAFNERFESGVMEITDDLHKDLATFAAKLVSLYNDPVLGLCLMFILAEAKIKPELIVGMAEAEQIRRSRNIMSLDQALTRRNDDVGVTPRIILNVLNGRAFSTFSNNRRVTEDDFLDVIAKLLQPVSPNRQTP